MGQGKGYEQDGQQKVYQNLTEQANTRSKSNDVYKSFFFYYKLIINDIIFILMNFV